MLRALGWTGRTVQVSAVAEDIFRDHLLNFSVEAAQEWGVDFWSQQPTEALWDAARKDSADLHAAGSFETLVQQRHSLRAATSLSPERVNQAVGSLLSVRSGRFHSLSHVDWNQMERDVQTLREFGQDGVPILTAADFSPSVRDESLPRGWAKNYMLAPAAVEALVYKAWMAGCGVFLTPEAAAGVSGRHEMRSSCAPKKGKQSGRLTLDGSTNSARTGPVLNSDEAKELCREIFGDILDQPDIEAICLMLIRMADLYGREFIVLWKTDMKAAFTLLKLRAALARLMSTRLMCGLVFIYTRGNFGWTGMPFAFQVVVRVLLVLVMSVIKGIVDMFVDDLIGGGHVTTWEADRNASIEIMRALLGSDAE
jgi:hypothetical protein